MAMLLDQFVDSLSREIHGVARYRCPSAVLPIWHFGQTPILSCGCEVWAVEADHKEVKQPNGLYILGFLRSIYQNMLPSLNCRH